MLGTFLALLGVAGAVLTRDLVGGLWLVLLGWFMTSVAAAEQRAAAARALLTGVRVADVMTPDPDLALAWLTAAEFIRQLGRRSAQTAFPVVEPVGNLTGIITVTQLSHVPAHSRDHVLLRQAAVPVPAEYLASPDDPAAQLLSRNPLGGEVVAVVEDHERITGLVTTQNIRQALRWRTLAGTTVSQAVGPSQRRS